CRQHATVRVAQHEALGAGLLGCGHDRHREAGVAHVPVEEVLGVEEDPTALSVQERDRVTHHRDPLFQVGAQRLGHVQIPGLADQADDLGAGVEQIAQHLRFLRALPGPAGHAERRELRVLQRLLGRELEDIRVARARTRPHALDVGEPDLVELVQDPQPVLDGIGEVRLLGAVAQRRVVELDGQRVAHAVAPSTTRSPTSVVEKPISPARMPFIRPVACRIPRSILSAAASSPSWRSSISIAPIAARGWIVPFPVSLGAVPPIGSNIDTPSGLMLPPAAMPIPPWIIAPRSVMMSPNMLSVTITSNRDGESRKERQAASTWRASVST